MLTSIIPGTLVLLILYGVDARTIWPNDNDSTLMPIISQSRKTRICSELCMSGLGGTPCGDSCFDLIPTNMPVEKPGQTSSSASENITRGSYNATTREDSCDVLCKNNLGFPLCGCTYNETSSSPDFFEVCSTFCVSFDYQIYGCQNCSLYIDYAKSKSSASSAFDTASLIIGTSSLGIGWNTWCREVCSDGNGGAACKCDLLP